MAGLSAAAVLASRFDSVVIVERDVVPDHPADRKGVPQGRHAHGLLPPGMSRLEGWFPGLIDELVADGAPLLDIGDDALWFQGGYRRRFPTGIKGPLASRALLEFHVRRRTLGLANVTLRAGAGAVGLLTDEEGTQVNGVHLADGTDLAADLVVDASGRQGRSLRWLEELGYDAPPTTEIAIDVAYASRIFQRDRHTGPPSRGDRTRQPGFEFAVVLAGPPTGRQGVAFPLEGDDQIGPPSRGGRHTEPPSRGGRWIVTLAGLHGERPPSDDAGFLAFARSLPSPEIAELVESSAPLGDIVTHRLHSNQRRHVERLRRVPGGLVLLGDAVCSFNPTYGQGMTTAALQAEALGKALDRSPDLDARFVKAFYKRAARAITPAWQVTTGADFALPATQGKKAPGTDLLNRYMPHVFHAAQVDDAVCLRLIEVTTLLKPPPALLTPAMLVRVFRASRRVPAPAPAAVPVDREPVAA
jgi:2-polyprenyl-6-methoxyphenol hydroxylase-like FAD-dependent oxidoreductase